MIPGRYFRTASDTERDGNVISQLILIVLFTTTPADSLSHIFWNKYCRQPLTYLSIYLLCSCCHCQPPKQFNHVTYLKCLSLLRNSSECYKPNYERTNKYTYSYSHPSAHNLWFIAILFSEIPVYYYIADFLKKLLFKCLCPIRSYFTWLYSTLLCSALPSLPPSNNLSTDPIVRLRYLRVVVVRCRN